MNTTFTCRRQEVDSPPTHLQQNKRENQPEKQEVLILAGWAKMQIKQITEPRSKGPCFFRIPTPIIAPRLFCPKSAHGHTQSQKSPSYPYQVITNSQLLDRCFLGRFTEPQLDRKQRNRSHHGIRKHVDYHMGNKPGTLKRWHQGFAMNFRFQHIDKNKHQRHQCAEAQYPFVFALDIKHQAYHGKKERVP